jgi:hypothetical protein
VTGPDNIKCNTPPPERRSLLEKVREKTEIARQHSKQWIHWLAPGIEEEGEEKGTSATNQGDNNNTRAKEPAIVLPR